MTRPAAVLVAALVAASGPAPAAIDLDVTVEDVEQALAVARGTDAERARFHAPYVQRLDRPLVESLEVVTEYRRIVLLAEARALAGDRQFAYSLTQAQRAAAPWKHRWAVVARLRFHPQNVYVAVPDAEVALEARPDARIGVLREPILSLPSAHPGDRQPILGARVEAVFDAVALHDGVHEFVVRVEGREAARASFDLDRLP